MPGTTVLEDIELVIEDIGGGGKRPPDDGHGGDDDGGGGGRKGPRGGGPGMPSSRRYSTAIVLAMVSVFMFFMAMAAAFLVLRATSKAWIPLRLPLIVWVNTVMLLASSATLEFARRQLALGERKKFRILWIVTTVLGLLFLGGQLYAWQELVQQGIHIASTLAGSFFYVFTALHGLHLVGGVLALLYVAIRNFDRARVSLRTASEVVSYYWHFMDGLWLFLLALLFLGK